MNKKVTSKGINVLVFFILIAIWVSLIYFSYNHLTNYIDENIKYASQQITEIENENNKKFKNLNDKIDSLNNELSKVNKNLDKYEKVLKDFENILDNLKEYIKDNQNINDQLRIKLNRLDQKIDLLDNNLKKLKEAPNQKN